MIILLLNSFDQKDHPLKEKVLEAVGKGKEKMTDTMFCRMIGGKKAWMANNEGGQNTA